MLNPKQASEILKQFISREQIFVLMSGLSPLERMAYSDRLINLATIINEDMPINDNTMPTSNDNTIYLHYFINGADWYVIEKDANVDGKGQIQAYGLVDFGEGLQETFISIKQMFEFHVQLDLAFQPRSVSELQENLKEIAETA